MGIETMNENGEIVQVEAVKLTKKKIVEMAIAELGSNARANQIHAWIVANYPNQCPTTAYIHWIISTLRKSKKRKKSKKDQTLYVPAINVTTSEENPLIPFESCNIDMTIKIIKLTKELIYVAGSKEELKRLIDSL